MLLHCEMSGGERTGLQPVAAWLRAETLDSLLELNELGLALLAEEAAARGSADGLPLPAVGELWRALEPAARRRAAACPYLLLDAGFADPQRWRRVASWHVGDAAAHGSYAAFFSVPGAIELNRLVLTYAWHLARTQGAAARLLLGMPAPCAQLIAQCSLRQMHGLAEAHPEWLRPRWAGREELWRELLAAAAAGEAGALEQAHMRGLTLLAAETRLALKGV
ncbi:MAG: hypothetical protein WBE65_04520 [Steroidobacteraceae bacterium]